MQEMQVQSLGQEDPLEGRARQPTPVFLPGKSHDREAWWATVCGGGGRGGGHKRVGHDLATKQQFRQPNAVLV